MPNSWQVSKLKTVVDIATVISLVAGVVIGFKALEEYRQANSVNTESTLLIMEKQIYQKVAEKPHLQALFARMPANVDVAAGSQQLLKVFLKEKQTLSFTWKDIPDLYDKLFQYDGFNEPDRVKLRDAYFLAEDILYLLLNCYTANQSSMESDTDFETWIAYIYDIGQHPLFLAAIYCGHKYGYIDYEFAEYLAKRIKKSSDIVAALRAVYPDMLESDWAQRTGKEWALKRPAHNNSVQ